MTPPISNGTISTGQVEIVDEVIYHKTEYRERRNHFAYFACSEKLAGFDTQRDSFLGAYRGWDAPVTVETGQSFPIDGEWLATHWFASRYSSFEIRRVEKDHISSLDTMKTPRKPSSIHPVLK